MEDGITEHEARLGRLPEPCSLALRLREAGADDRVICTSLHVEPEALPTLLKIAEAKLVAARNTDRPPGTTGSNLPEPSPHHHEPSTTHRPWPRSHRDARCRSSRQRHPTDSRSASHVGGVSAHWGSRLPQPCCPRRGILSGSGRSDTGNGAWASNPNESQSPPSLRTIAPRALKPERRRGEPAHQAASAPLGGLSQPLSDRAGNLGSPPDFVLARRTPNRQASTSPSRPRHTARAPSGTRPTCSTCSRRTRPALISGRLRRRTGTAMSDEPSRASTVNRQSGLAELTEHDLVVCLANR
jgi:hypothetical protein